MKNNNIYALDFDGVICDSAIETSITGWKAAQTIWPDMLNLDISTQQVEQFRHVRPVLETGYEAILIMRLLHQGITEADLVADYEQYITSLITADHIDTAMLKRLYGETRDQWIQRNEADWLDHNPLFAGIKDKLQQLSGKTWYVITTKQERFVTRILQGNNIELAEAHIFGMDRQLNKQQVLRQLITNHPENTIIFIEDRLPTLTNILKNQALQSLTLQLVDWGYNTARDRETARQQSIPVIKLAEFLGVEL